LLATIDQVGEFVDDDDDVGQRLQLVAVLILRVLVLLERRLDVPVELIDAADAVLGERLRSAPPSRVSPTAAHSPPVSDRRRPA
jgi:hypothetical protein